jgi:hypothetical protein
MSDSTLLSILRSVGETPMTQAEIVRKLRLRPPTISHHLKSLRRALPRGWRSAFSRAFPRPRLEFH